MARHAWSTFQIKAVDSAARRLEGIASTPELDRQGDRMDPRGATFRLPLPLLWQHRTDQPIGTVTAAGVTDAGIRITAEIAAGVLPFIDDAWALIQAGLVRGLSIGWRPLADPVAHKSGWTWPKWEWLELSAVTIPANQSASIALVKSLDTLRPPGAAFGRSGMAGRFPLGVASSPRDRPMNISEQLTTERDVLTTKAARLEALVAKAGVDGGLEDDETAEQATLETEIGGLTARIKTLSTLEAAQAAQAVTVGYPPAAPAPPAAPGRVPRVEIPELPKGTRFARYAMAIAAGKGSISDTIAYARRWSSTPEVLAYIKSAEGTPVAPNWGAPLAAPNTIQTEFVELLRPETLIGRVPGGFWDVPFNIPIVTQTGGSLIAWVGPGALKPVGELAFTTATLTFSKVAGIVVLSDELIRLSTPSAETTVRNDLVAQAAKFLDEQFIHSGVAATPANPASITNGVTSIPATGTTYTALLKDLNTALATFDAAGIPTDGLVIATTPALARGISAMTTPLGTVAFPALTPSGGSLMGYPVLVSSAVEAGKLVIFKPKEIFMADDKRVTLDSSNQATLDMDGVAGPTFNLWQRNCVGIRAEQWIRWQKRRAGVVAVISAAAYAP